jgi:hypothetical protein
MGAVPQDIRREPTLDEPLNPVPEPAPQPALPEAGSSTPLPPPEAPGLGEQIGATRDAGKRLIGAHVELAKSEFGDIADAAKRAAALVGIAVAAGLVAGLIETVGLPLFLGEAIFGSIGWWILLGVLFLAAIAVAVSVAALRPGVQASIGQPFLAGFLVAVIVGIVLGLNLTNRGWAALADTLVPAMDAAYRPLVVAVVSLAVIGTVIGLIGGAMAGGSGAAIGGLLAGLLTGIFLGFLTAFAPGLRVGVAIGVAAGLITWTVGMGVGIARGEFDTEALKDRFWPARTIEATKETIEWARERMPLSRRS